MDNFTKEYNVQREPGFLKIYYIKIIFAGPTRCSFCPMRALVCGMVKVVIFFFCLFCETK